MQRELQRTSLKGSRAGTLRVMTYSNNKHVQLFKPVDLADKTQDTEEHVQPRQDKTTRKVTLWDNGPVSHTPRHRVSRGEKLFL